jgi:hypothetical protein
VLAQVACHALLLRRTHVPLLARSLAARLGPRWTCADLALRLRQAGYRVAAAAGSVMFWGGAERRSPLGLPDAQPPGRFFEAWRGQLWALHNESQEVRASGLATSWERGGGGGSRACLRQPCRARPAAGPRSSSSRAAPRRLPLLQVGLSLTWVAHCGGSQGLEAFNLAEGLEGRLPLRLQVSQGPPAPPSGPRKI